MEQLTDAVDYTSKDLVLCGFYLDSREAAEMASRQTSNQTPPVEVTLRV